MMKLIIGNDIKIENPNDAIKRYCDTKLTIDNPTYINAERLGRYLGNIPKKMKLYIKDGNCLKLPFGCLKEIWKDCYGSIFETKFAVFKGNSMQGGITLRDYQERALKSLLEGKNGVLQAPCGSGKTQIGLQLIKSIGGKALWLTHTKKLLDQSKQRCETYFTGDFGTITEGNVNIGKDITFATVQTMSKLDVETYKDAFDIVVVDECHHCIGSPTKVMQFYKIITNCNCRYKYGLSATLNRADNMISCVFYLIGGILHTIKKEEVGDYTVKAEHRKVDIDLEYNMFEYLDTDGTINYTKLINMLSTDERRNKIILDNILECDKQGRKQIVLCHRVNQAELLYNELSKVTKASLVVGKIKGKKREFTGNIIVATYSLASEGLDIPDLDTLHLVTPQKNKSTTEQCVGRIERSAEGKGNPICYDYVDTTISYCINCYKQRKRVLK